MKEVIRLPGLSYKMHVPVELTHRLTSEYGWKKITTEENSNFYNKLVYMGNCYIDGDIFIGYNDDMIFTLKGHLNSGFYE